MKYREHRGGLADSMKTVREIQPSLGALAIALKVPPSAITVNKYGDYDKRIGWDTHIVCVNGSPTGFTDGPVTDADGPKHEPRIRHHEMECHCSCGAPWPCPNLIER
jgi:hypothetical protein